MNPIKTFTRTAPHKTLFCLVASITAKHARAHVRTHAYTHTCSIMCQWYQQMKQPHFNHGGVVELRLWWWHVGVCVCVCDVWTRQPAENKASMGPSQREMRALTLMEFIMAEVYSDRGWLNGNMWMTSLDPRLNEGWRLCFFFFLHSFQTTYQSYLGC